MNILSVMTFSHDPTSTDTWNAYHAAERYCREQGWSVGSMQRGSPTAVFEGDCVIAKWRNLSSKERDSALAVITSCTGTFRDSDVSLNFFRDPVQP